MHTNADIQINCHLPRFGTISHILASTDLNCCTKKEDVLSDEALIEKNAVEIVKQMQRLKGIDGDYDSDSAASNRLAQRHTIQVARQQICDL
jgi:chitin synthase